VWKFPSYPSNWQELREIVLKRDGYKCRICGSTSQLDVAHIVPLSRGGKSEPNNLKTKCKRCHSKERGHSHYKHLLKKRRVI
jgi:5-methylcytosine-specific restriction endonuclease McrA